MEETKYIASGCRVGDADPNIFEINIVRMAQMNRHTMNT